MAEGSEAQQPFSALLDAVCDHPEPRISVGELTERFGGRAIGALLFIFGLVCTLPLPPGSTTIFGLPLLLLAPQLILKSHAPWLPKNVRARTLDVGQLKSGLARALPWLRRVEAVSRPRFGWLFSDWGQRVIGIICTALAFVLILPIPLGNILPALAVAVLSFSLVQRDGVLAVLGFALAAASAGVLVLAGHVVIRALQHFATMIAPA